MIKASQQSICYTQGILLLIAALSAFAGGYYGMSGASGVSVEWLNASPFPALTYWCGFLE